MKSYSYMPAYEGCIGVVSEFVEDIAALQRLPLPPGRKVLLLVADGDALDVDTIYNLAMQWLEGGVVYFLAWGPGCERVHDIWDEADVMHSLGVGVPDAVAWEGNPRHPFAISTWHEGVPMNSAVQFFLRCAEPSDDKSGNSRPEYKAEGGVTCVALVLGNPEWREAMERVLADPDAFVDEWYAEE